MPYQPINYANIEPMKGPDLFSNLLRGYKASKLPGQFERQEESELLKNKLLGHNVSIKGAEADFAERQQEAILGQRMAAALRQRQLAGGGGGGRGGSGGKATAGRIPTSTDPKEMRILFNAFGPDAKAELFAIGSALGMNPQETQKFFISGGDFKEEAAKQGKDYASLDKNFLSTASNRTQQKNMDAAAAELSDLETENTKGFGKYGSTVLGKPVKFIWDSIRDKNKDERIQFLASIALQPEVAGARQRISGGSNAHEALKDAQKAALADFDIYRDLVSADEFVEVQHEINRRITKALKARRENLYNIKSEGKSGSGSDPLGIRR